MRGLSRHSCDEGGAAGVVGASVDLDDQAGVAPEEAVAVAAAFFERYPGVDLGLGEAVAFDYCEEAFLGCAVDGGGGRRGR
jgi:hypothetical protein